ncbi:MAG: hypothetical protein NVS3B21_15570 [Acidimicrobiales bacterium]
MVAADTRDPKLEHARSGGHPERVSDAKFTQASKRGTERRSPTEDHAPADLAGERAVTPVTGSGEHRRCAGPLGNDLAKMDCRDLQIPHRRSDRKWTAGTIRRPGGRHTLGEFTSKTVELGLLCGPLLKPSHDDKLQRERAAQQHDDDEG